MLENIEGAIKNGQSRKTGNIGHIYIILLVCLPCVLHLLKIWYISGDRIDVEYEHINLPSLYLLQPYYKEPLVQ